jgi:hypothetical protein
MSNTNIDKPTGIFKSVCPDETPSTNTEGKCEKITQCCSYANSCPDGTPSTNTPCCSYTNSCPDRESNPVSKRKMRPPDSGVSQVFSQLFSSLIGSGDQKGDQKGKGKGINGDTLAVWENMIHNLSKKSSTDDTSSDTSSETDTSSEDGDYSDEEEKSTDPRWKAMNKLMESHYNITRAIVSLVRSD